MVLAQADLIDLVQTGGAVAVLALVVTLFLRGVIVTGTSCDKRLADKEKQADFWQSLALDMLGKSERATTVAERAAKVAQTVIRENGVQKET
jgi:hypothetical protein